MHYPVACGVGRKGILRRRDDPGKPILTRLIDHWEKEFFLFRKNGPIIRVVSF
jgi:hypothetical protein